MNKRYNTRYRRVIYHEKKKIVSVKLILLIIALIVLVSSAVFFIYNYDYISSQVLGTGKAVLEVGESVYGSIIRIIGLSIENAEQQEATTGEKQKIEKEKEGKTEEKENKQEKIQEPEGDITEEREETEENITEEINLTIPETIKEANITEINETLTNITEIIEENITEEINLTIPETINETIEEANITEINETLTNITALNITTNQYKAVINRKVKWIKTFKVEKETNNSILELPKQATNITVKTGQEVQKALNEIQDYEEVISRADREDIKEGITGYVSLDIRESKGILTRLINWIKQLTITGDVIQETELRGEITEKQDIKEIDLTNIIEQAAEKEEIAVEYYTDAPISEEKIISRGKQVIISGPDELNYTDILAYTLLDNRILINNSNKIKIYWLREEAKQIIEETQEQELEEATEEITETTGIEENQTIEIINETEQPVNNSSAELNNLIDIENNIIENKTKDKEEKQEKDKTKEQQTSPITAFAIKDKEKKNKNEEGQLQEIQTSVVREEVNFTAYDLDEDGMIDYVEWNVPHLSNQTYEIIYISKAEHLDENYIFIEDVYEQVKELDNNYTLIPNRDYIRVTFEKELDNTKDITIYARVKDNCSVSGNENNSIMINGIEVPCDIYQKKMRIDEIRRLMGE
jgi:hypothetical protein